MSRPAYFGLLPFGRVGRLPPSLTRQRIRRRLLSYSIDSLRLIRRKRFNIRVEVLIDHSAHALLAMCSLTAVVPERIQICHSVGKDEITFAFFSGKVEAREDALFGTNGLTRLARLIESGLDDAVVGFNEVPFDVVADCCYNVLGLEVEATVGGGGACSNAVDNACETAFAGCSGGEAKDGECNNGDRGETDHVDRLTNLDCVARTLLTVIRRRSSGLCVNWLDGMCGVDCLGRKGGRCADESAVNVITADL
jgi:hypothetical protein